ncbi:hypothetical protein N7526_004021 [Penicillium atrosanguineum]|nr:hypothetical protein N7526_004021 [Penicillium atrosanguineum]
MVAVEEHAALVVFIASLRRQMKLHRVALRGNDFCCQVGLIGVYQSSGKVAGTCVASGQAGTATAARLWHRDYNDYYCYYNHINKNVYYHNGNTNHYHHECNATYRN